MLDRFGWAVVFLLPFALSGCVAASHDGASAVEPVQPRREPATCQILVSGLGGPPSGSSLQGNACDVSSLGVSGPLAALDAEVAWASLQPTLDGRVRVTLEDLDCDKREACILAQASANRVGPVRLQASAQQLAGHRTESLALLVYPEGYCYGQPFDVWLDVQQA